VPPFLKRGCRRGALLLVLAASAWAQKYYTYVADLGPDYLQLAWGTTTGDNTIGRSSVSHGEATIKIDRRTLTSRPNTVTVSGLQPDHPYTYEIWIGGRRIGEGQIRTWAAHGNRLCFFVIGDYGTGSRVQYQVAQAMWREFQKRADSDNPVRFVLSTGDNIYGDFSGFLIGVRHTGSSDGDWTNKFFEPYEPLLARIPWFPSLGNHDGNETESRGDLDAYLDNMPFPGGTPGRYYHFNYGELAEFFALDSTRNTESGQPRPAYSDDTPQFKWMRQEFPKATAPWVIPYYHHPAFNAGPLHVPAMRELRHWMPLFVAAHVNVVFNGHEHNFQVSEANDLSFGIRFITSGAGGELRPGNVRKKMKAANIAAWAPQNHFLVVEIEGKTMRVTPLSFSPMAIVDSNGNPVQPPFVITLP
jgi:tartrate-resistant acid phosphatase type 5